MEQLQNVRTTVVQPRQSINTDGGITMDDMKNTLAVRSVSNFTRTKLDHLRAYTRLTCGSLIDDAVDALWREYVAEGHDLP